MHWTDRRERFRAVLAGDRCVHPGSVFDPISARIAEELGFEVGMFAGSIASFTVLGAPDLIVLTLTEFAAQAYRINRAGKLPLLVDAGSDVVPTVLIAHIAARNRFRHEAFEMLVKARMCPEQLNCLGPSRVVEMLVSDQCDDLVAGRIPGHRLGGHVLCAEHSAKEQQTSTH